jgi:hypothetical protein
VCATEVSQHRFIIFAVLFFGTVGVLYLPKYKPQNASKPMYFTEYITPLKMLRQAFFSNQLSDVMVTL